VKSGFKKISARKNDVEFVEITNGDFYMESWQYKDCVMFDTKPNGKFVLTRAQANKLAEWIIRGKQN
jgi:hypothetical protein